MGAACCPTIYHILPPYLPTIYHGCSMLPYHGCGMTLSTGTTMSALMLPYHGCSNHGCTHAALPWMQHAAPTMGALMLHYHGCSMTTSTGTTPLPLRRKTMTSLQDNQSTQHSSNHCSAHGTETRTLAHMHTHTNGCMHKKLHLSSTTKSSLT